MRLRFFFDWGSGSALWPEAGSPEVGPLDEVVPLSPDTRRALQELAAWWDTDLDWSDPAGPGLWSAWDRERFHREASLVLEQVRREVGMPVVADWLAPAPLQARPPAPPGTCLLEDPREVERLLGAAPNLHLYALGDLDPLAWREAAFYEREGAVVLGWYGVDPPCYAALGATRELLELLAPVLPERMYLQLSPGMDGPLHERFDMRRESVLERRILARPAPSPTHQVETLGPREHRDLRDLYAQAYPDGWFDPRTLATERYVGLRREGRLVSVAGVHVWSPGRGVAALGNIATHPAWRGQGLATACVAGLCKLLRRDGIERVGLNVSAANEPARRCYAGLGFETVALFEEWTAVRR